MKKLLSTTIAALSIAMVSQADFSQFADAQDMFCIYNWCSGHLRWWRMGCLISELMLELAQGLDNISKPKCLHAQMVTGQTVMVTSGWFNSKYEMAGSNALSAQQTNASMTFDVNSYTLDSRYTVTAFVKTLDPNNGYSVSANDSVVLSDGLGETTLSLDTSALAGHILQVGFETQGINANPATDWGNADVSISDINVIPEPATMGLLGIFGGALAMARRRFSV